MIIIFIEVIHLIGYIKFKMINEVSYSITFLLLKFFLVYQILDINLTYDMQILNQIFVQRLIYTALQNQLLKHFKFSFVNLIPYIYSIFDEIYKSITSFSVIRVNCIRTSSKSATNQFALK